MSPEHFEMLERLLAALVAGGVIGLERGYHGHAAGLRTHALVSVSSAMLMLVTAFQEQWMPELANARIALDPTRMAQGIMTGIGFLGGGAIMKDGLTVRGLTTAGSIWATAALGILIGIGFYFAAAMALLAVLATLTMVNWIESRLPSLYRGTLTVTFPGDAVPEETELRALLAGHGFHVHDCDYRLSDDRRRFDYKMGVSNRDPRRVPALTQTLRARADVCEFSLSPTGD